jgi:hypothetical protein
MREENDQRGEGQMFCENRREDDDEHSLGSADRSISICEFTSSLRKSKTGSQEKVVSCRWRRAIQLLMLRIIDHFTIGFWAEV